MATKKLLTKTDARLIVYFHNVAKHLRNCTKASEKLGVDYVYVRRRVKLMVLKGWLKEYKSVKGFFYEVTSNEVYQMALNFLEPEKPNDQGLVKKIKNFFT